MHIAFCITGYLYCINWSQWNKWLAATFLCNLWGNLSHKCAKHLEVDSSRHVKAYNIILITYLAQRGAQNKINWDTDSSKEIQALWVKYTLFSSVQVMASQVVWQTGLLEPLLSIVQLSLTCGKISIWDSWSSKYSHTKHGIWHFATLLLNVKMCQYRRSPDHLIARVQSSLTGHLCSKLAKYSVCDIA